MADEDLRFLTATEAAALIRRRALSPVTLTQAILTAIEASQPSLNAFATITAEAALRDATAAEQAVMRGDTLGPLHGVPVHIKDQIDTAGIPTRHGSAIFADNIPMRDDITVTRLRAAGAIILGKTTMSEFGHKGLTDSPAHGVTRNPWDLDRTPGGSSGGAAAAVAAGLGPLGLGTDGAGSVRIPAACCGLIGLKGTLGAVPWEAAADGFSNNVYAGPISRSVADTALMFAIIAGPSARDPQSLRAHPFAPVAPHLAGTSLHGLRIGFIEKASNPKVQREVLANTHASLAALEARGAHIEPVTTPIDWIEYEGRVMYQAGFAISCAQYLPEWHNRMDPVLIAFMERGRAFTAHQLRDAQFARTRLFRQIQSLFDTYDILATPTLTRTALPTSFDAAHDQIVIEGTTCGITRQGWSSYQYPFNLTGHPAITIPSGFADDGLPTGLQLIGPWTHEPTLLHLASALEADRPWAQHRPSGWG